MIKIEEKLLISKIPTILIDCFILCLLLISTYLLFLGNRPLVVPDEGRYAEIAREMFNSKNYLVPRLNGVLYFEKPILFYWLETIVVHFFGLKVTALRSINVGIGVLGCLLTYGFARILYDRKTGLLASIILGTSLLYFTMSHMITLDVPVSFFLSASLFVLYLGLRNPTSVALFYAAASLSACAVLTKGLIGIIFPALILFFWITLTGNWHLLKRIPFIKAFIFFLMIAGPWHFLLFLKHPAFFHFYFIEQHFLRYTQHEIGHYQPNYFFIFYLAIGLFPWIVFLFPTVAEIPKWIKHKKNYAAELFLFIWAFTIFIFFSFSKSKLIPYILPIFPPLAILIARYLTLQMKNNFLNLTIKKTIIYFLMMIVTWFSILLITFKFLDNRTILPLANIIKKKITLNDEVIAYNKYYQDLPFYLERQVSIANWQNELTFGMQHQDSPTWLFNDAIFWEKWHSRKRLFVVLSKESFQHLLKQHPHITFFVLGSTQRDVLVTNRS